MQELCKTLKLKARVFIYRNIKSILKANKAFKHCVSTLWQKLSMGCLTVTRLAQTQSYQFNVILMYCNQYDFWLYPCIDNQIWFGTLSTPHNYINQRLEKISLSSYQQVVIHSVCVALPTYRLFVLAAFNHLNATGTDFFLKVPYPLLGISYTNTSWLLNRCVYACIQYFLFQHKRKFCLIYLLPIKANICTIPCVSSEGCLYI